MSAEKQPMEEDAVEENWPSDASRGAAPDLPPPAASVGGGKYVAYTVKLPAEQLAALQSIWLELKKMYGTHSPDKSGMIQQAIGEWLRKWDGPEHQELLRQLLDIREDTRRRQYRKTP